MTTDYTKIIKDHYYDPEFGLMSPYKLYKKLKEKYPDIKLKTIKHVIDNQEVNQINKPIHRQKKYNTIYSPYPLYSIQLDIKDMGRKNVVHRYRYILVIIDVNSRLAKLVPLTSREGPSIIKAITRVFEEIGWPKNVNCDQEFNSNEMNSLMKKHKVKMWYSHPDQKHKNAIVEIFNRYLGAKLHKWMDSSHSYEWYKILPKIENNHNTTEHSTTEAKPQDIYDGADFNKQEIIVMPRKFNVGDKVRIEKKKDIFKKGYKPTFSKTIYSIVAISGHQYILENERGKRLEKTYKDYELIKVSGVERQEIDNNIKEKIQHKQNVKKARINQELDKEGVEEKNIARGRREMLPSEKLIQSIQNASEPDRLREIINKTKDKTLKKKKKDDKIYTIEKVLERKKIKGKNMVLVKWKDYDNTHNSWIPESNMIDI
jgi:hypothetical protein